MTEQPRILVSGANGFIGAALCGSLEKENVAVIRAVRNATWPQEVAVGEINAATNWAAALAARPQVAVHLAGLAHAKAADSARALAHYRAINTEGTLAFARACAASGVRRFVFMSSAKVFGEGRETAYGEIDMPAPEGPYAISKWEAEQGLARISHDTGMETVILRPPVVYGPGMRANFLSLMKAVQSGKLLPIGAIRNCRSAIYLGNLIAALRVCLAHPAAAGKTYAVCDDEALSVPELVAAMAKASGVRPRVLAVPLLPMRLAAAGLGKSAGFRALTGSFILDAAPLKQDTGWKPAYSLAEGLTITADWMRGR